MILRALCVGAVAVGFTGCASIVGGWSETLSIKTISDGADVAGAQCDLTNIMGTWHVTTPGPVTIRRSFDDLKIHCACDRFSSNIGHVPSSTRALVFGNILLPGSLVATALDIGTGSAFDYPSPIVVKLHPEKKETAQAAPGS
jgi:hypothetical protein